MIVVNLIVTANIKWDVWYKNSSIKQLNKVIVGVLAETELIPFITNKELNEKDPELESLLTDKTAGE